MISSVYVAVTVDIDHPLKMNKPCVSVVVLGDVGRSPRMQYHALSFAKEGYNVDVIGYGGSKPVTELAEHPNVNFRYVTPCPDLQKWCPRLFAYFFKVLWQAITLFFTLLLKRLSHHVLVQNPPAVPTLGVCWFYCLLTRANYVIDWHNYGYSILALTLGDKHVLVRICYWFEGYFGRKANANLCVTKAMKKDLQTKWGIVAVTLYDRPPESFRPSSVFERHHLFTRLGKEYPVFADSAEADRTSFTEVQTDGKTALRDDRPGLVLSSTSWTEDEDFSILLSALQDYDDLCTSEPTEFPALVCAITGKGPLKDYYCNLIAQKKWKHVQVVTPWLQPDDYPQLLAAADLGVCLHTSSSGLDLPMKVVDMFGCGLPVCAYSFACLDELVHHNENSLQFKNAAQLSEQLRDWFRGFPSNKSQQQRNEKFRNELHKFQKLRWHDNWSFNALPIFK